MNQRHAVATVIVGSGLLPIPLSLVFALAAELGQAAVPMGVVAMVGGFGCLLCAKWPTLRAGRLRTFGPRKLARARRRLYWAGYVLMISAAGLALGGRIASG